MPDILEKDRIPYEDQAQLLFNLDGEGLASPAEQQIVPFLGAGVSISGRTFSADPKPSPNYPDREKLELIFQELGLDGQAKTFLEIAILLACRLQFSQSQRSQFSKEELLKRLQSYVYPPSVIKDSAAWFTINWPHPIILRYTPFSTKIVSRPVIGQS